MVLYSGLMFGQWYVVWCGFCRGDFMLVVGVCFVLFVPVPNLGVIVVDEEYDLFYK